MTRTLAVALTAAALYAHPVAGQAVRPRSGDYLFIALVSGTRATWLNPAGLGVVREASVMAEFALDRPVDGDLRLGQWTLALNSRGISLGYQRDRLPEGAAEAFRLGASLPFRGGAIGGAFTLYRGGVTDQGGDLGVTYRLARSLSVAATLRNIGRPTLRDSVAPLVGAVGLGWLPVANRVELAAEAHFAERLTASGYDATYRAGAQVSTGSRVPLALVTALDFGSNLKIDGWTVGISVGRSDRGILLVTGIPTTTSSAHLSRFSLTGVASRRPTGVLR
ncbi:MAG: hypothetical protein GTN62_03870 [Gemmatimonadales bacterium]|nr:hypothetical protein [Gemmatimonadales bacterium]NIN10445.1 hypothetical protein [Gemmatimonadales bacterium]NIN49237.1 hypothetical protein [Gemmatimonadales bacterium]NIP06701.1 hypothetical protein [Gemmatimonadales bacterium]NIR00032.1 hypothetical protein [Gemmatimonadales bacterium]